MTRAMVVALALLAALALGGLGYGRHEAGRAQAAARQLAAAQGALAALQARVSEQNAAVETLQRQGREAAARVDAAQTSATRIRRGGEVKAQGLLVTQAAPLPEPALIRWATAEAQDLSRRLEAP